MRVRVRPPDRTPSVHLTEGGPQGPDVMLHAHWVPKQHFRRGVAHMACPAFSLAPIVLRSCATAASKIHQTVGCRIARVVHEVVRLDIAVDDRSTLVQTLQGTQGCCRKLLQTPRAPEILRVLLADLQAVLSHQEIFNHVALANCQKHLMHPREKQPLGVGALQALVNHQQVLDEVQAGPAVDFQASVSLVLSVVNQQRRAKIALPNTLLHLVPAPQHAAFRRRARPDLVNLLVPLRGPDHVRLAQQLQTQHDGTISFRASRILDNWLPELPISLVDNPPLQVELVVKHLPCHV
mmetsp:Transcript_4051/g.9805  ORF Transcript_4051/g.9805 Transcript_4051/m.9805 type:complete len:294 (+) Transcript_4051:480-1361(+)